MTTQELTDEQVEQVDKINNIAFRAVAELLDIEPENLQWDMEWIGIVSDVLSEVAQRFFGKTEMEVYPYIDEEE